VRRCSQRGVCEEMLTRKLVKIADKEVRAKRWSQRGTCEEMLTRCPQGGACEEMLTRRRL
jgi:hypothetical protein